MEYGHPILLNCRRPAQNNIQIAERTSLRKITKIRHPDNPLHNPPNEMLYNLTQIQPIQDRLMVLNSKFYKRLKNLHDILPLFHNDMDKYKSRRKFPENTIYQHLGLLG